MLSALDVPREGINQSHMQHAWKHVERPGGSHTALEGKKIDVPRKSRHMEVRIFWLREQLERYIQLGWIEATNLSDTLTKCSSYHFVPGQLVDFNRKARQ